MLNTLSKHFLRNRILIFLIFLGSISWSLTMVKSGIIYDFGMGFWGPNGHDGVWHIALSESFARGSYEMPTFSGDALKNYHIGFDLLVAAVHKLTSIPVANIYFQIIPPILAFLIGILTYKFVYLWTKSKGDCLWAVFFVYFGGSFGWVVTLLRSGEVGGESMFWSQQAISTLINPPFALSLVLILLALIFLHKYLRDSKKSSFLLSFFFFGILIQIKAYAGLLCLAGLLVTGVFDLMKEKRWAILKVFASTLAISLLLTLPFVKSTEGLFIFQPFWFLETMMGLSDRLGWLKFHSAMTSYRFGNLWVKATAAYLVAFAIFWVGNMGTRIIKEILVLKWLGNLKKISWLELFVSFIVVSGGIIPMFFLQSGTPWNTIQFFYYSLFFSGILAGISVSQFLGRNGTVSAAVILLTIPTSLSTLYYHYLPGRPPAMISKAELEALNFLARQPNGAILTYPFDRIKAKEAEANPPRPLYLYESTAYVSAFAKKPVFLEDEVNLDITGYNWRERRREIEEFYSTLDQAKARSFLKENGLDYIYWTDGQRATLGESQLGITRIFENDAVDIFKVE